MKLLTLALLPLGIVLQAQAANHCLGKFCIGFRILDQWDMVGEVTEIGEDGQIHYQIGSAFFQAPPSSLGLLVPEFKGISAGKRILDAHNQIGVVRLVFDDGRVQYQTESKLLVTNRFSVEVASLKGFARDKGVIDERNAIGTVTAVFSDGRVQYQVGSKVLFSTGLSPEVETHPLYEKKEIYATTDGWVGQVARFFENGKLLHVAFEGVRSLETKLLTPVDEIQVGNQVYAVGASTMNDLQLEGVIERVFENGVLCVLTTVPGVNGGEPLRRTGKVAGGEADEVNRWAIGVARKVSGESRFDHWLTVPRSTVTVEGLPKVKAAVIRRLIEQPSVIADPALRKKVLEYLSANPNGKGSIISDGSPPDSVTAP